MNTDVKQETFNQGDIGLIFCWYLLNYKNKSNEHDTWEAHENGKTSHLQEEESHKLPHLERCITFDRFCINRQVRMQMFWDRSQISEK